MNDGICCDRVMRRTVVIAAVVLLAAQVGLSSASAQMGRGRVTGSVVDQDDNPLEGAKVVAKPTQGGNPREATTDDKGHFGLLGLTAGMYEISASKDGYNEHIKEVQISELSRNEALAFKILKMQAQAGALGGESGAAGGEGTGPSPEDIELVRVGNELFNQGKYAEAAAEFEKFLANNPTVNEIRINAGNAYTKAGAYDKAREQFQKIIDVDASSSAAMTALANTYIAEGKPDQAGPYLEKAAELNPTDANLFFTIGSIHFRVKATEKAAAAFKKAIELKPEWPDPYVQLGYCQMQLGDNEGAKASFKKLLELAPDHPEASVVKEFLATVK
ncbi:MAG: tetratricopeptide repeat protein [Candidatus Schekmanbacteria bacterium]|nr:tetratricopeptide repeat protein [Candidatus Schekmanbacteria bacterium]